MNYKLLLSILLIGITTVGLFTTFQKEEVVEEVAATAVKRVETQSVAQLNGKQDTVVAYGQVVSATGVAVVPESSGQVLSVNKRLGNFVQAGELVLQLQNNTQRQSLLQAQASLAQAQANLDRVRTAQPQDLQNLQIDVSVRENTLKQAIDNAQIESESALTVARNILENTIDNQFFGDVTNIQIEFLPPSNSQIKESLVEDRRITIAQETEKFAGQIQTASQTVSGQTALLKQAQVLSNSYSQYVADITDLINKVPVSVNTTRSTIDAWQASLLQAKQILENKTLSINNQINALSNADLAVKASENTVSSASTGVQESDVAVARSQVLSAQANVGSAQIALQRTQVRAPVAGNISEIDIRVGDIVGQSQPVFTLANENTLRIDTAVSQATVSRINVGTRVLVDDQHEAFVSVIAPTIDDVTGKVTLQVLLRDQNLTLVTGAGVGLEIIPDGQESNVATQESVLYVPIDAIFVRGGQSHVYVLENNKAIVRPIETKTLFGDQIEVLGGLENNEIVILNARGVKDNEEVSSVTDKEEVSVQENSESAQTATSSQE